MLLRAPGAVNFNHPRSGWLFEWVVTRIGREEKKGVVMVSRGFRDARGGRRGRSVTVRYMYRVVKGSWGRTRTEVVNANEWQERPEGQGGGGGGIG